MCNTVAQPCILVLKREEFLIHTAIPDLGGSNTADAIRVCLCVSRFSPSPCHQYIPGHRLVKSHLLAFSDPRPGYPRAKWILMNYRSNNRTVLYYAVTHKYKLWQWTVWLICDKEWHSDPTCLLPKSYVFHHVCFPSSK